MKKGAVTKARKPRAKRIVELRKPIVCQICGGKGYIELDKVGLVISPCYNCEKGKEQARAIGVPEDVIRIRTGANIDNGTVPIDNGTGQPDNFTGVRDAGQPSEPKEPEITEAPGSVLG